MVFAKVAIFRCGQNKELFEGDKVVDLPVVQQLKRFTDFLNEKYIIDLQTFRTGYTRLKKHYQKKDLNMTVKGGKHFLMYSIHYTLRN